MKWFRLITLAGLVLVLAPSLFAADFGIRAGRYDEGEGEFVGAEMLFDLGLLNVNPNIEYSLENDITAGSANLDIVLEVGNFNRASPYVGAGVGLFYADTDAGDTAEVLGNLIGGVQFDLDFLKPYVQVKYFRLLEDDQSGDADDLAFAVGLRF